MYQNSLKLSKFICAFARKGLRSTRLHSATCLHCQKLSGQTGRMVMPRRDYSSLPEGATKSHPIRNTLIVLGVTTGGVIGYAKLDRGFRKLIEDNAPAFNEFIKIVTQEERSFGESYDVVTKYFGSLVNDLIGASEPVQVPKTKLPPPIVGKEIKAPVSTKSEVKPSEIVSKPVSSSLPPPPPPTAKPPSVKEENEKPSVAKNPPVSLGKIEDEIRVAKTGALLALQEASSVIIDCAEVIGKLLESDIENRSSSLWDDIKDKTSKKEQALLLAEKSASETTSKLNKLRAEVESSAASQEDKERIRKLLLNAASEIESSRRELEVQKKRSSVTERYWSKVEDARRLFQEEIQALFPGAKITDKKLQLSDVDLDLFLTHVFKHVTFYQQELTRLEEATEQKLRQALERSGESVSEEVIALKIQQAVENEKRKLEEALQRRLLIVRNEHEKEMKQVLKRQLESVHDHYNDVLNAKEADLERRVARKLDEKDFSKQAEYDAKLVSMLSQLKALDTVLSERIEADRNAHQAHVLFSACQSLFRALRSGVPGTHWSDQLRPLNPELSAVSNAVGGKDPLVATVLSSVPVEARDRGVYPETALRERFLRVEQVARKVALIPENGGSLLRYLVSYLQSTLLFSSPAIPTKELRDEPVDVSKLDTYDLLQRARYWVDRGDLKMSLRYMNLLRGASRAVASQWMDETRIFLETQLIVNTLMAHAAATGMLYL